MKDVISVFGLGKLGCTMLSCFAHKGWSVIGVDINEVTVGEVNQGLSPIFEPGVGELIKGNKDRISATTDIEKAINGSQASFVIVPTPSLENGAFSLEYVEEAIAGIGSVLKSKEEYHLVVITSTVLPGDMEILIDLLEKKSGKKCRKDFGVCYNPDFIALGNIVRDFLNPDLVLIGESDEKAGSILEGIHKRLVDNCPNIHRMNLHNAELAKISLNSYCTLKITFANTLAEICEKMPGGDAMAVSNAIGDDRRIGRHCLKGGLSFGGPCFPRDNMAFAHSAGRFGITHVLADKTDEINDFQRKERIPQKIIGLLKEKGTNELAVLGLTYKKDSTLIEESAAISIIEALLGKKVRITVYDPVGMDEAKEKFKGDRNIDFASSPLECLKGKSVCFIATPWDEFSELSSNDFKNAMGDPVVFDAWNLFDFSDEVGIDYRQIGRNY
jgi:UDPglucose 6-dehydrogenase